MILTSIEEVIANGSPIEKDLRHLFGKDNSLLILDIGACTGEDSIIYANLFPNATIIAFEPLPANQEVINQHINKFGKQLAIRKEAIALSDEEGEFSFYVSGGSPYSGQDVVNTSIIPKEWNKSSSLLKPGPLLEREFPWLKFGTKIDVKTQRLDTYLKLNEIATVDFIHMDVQGAELKVLLGLGKKIRDVKVIWLEVENVELYENQPLKKDIQSYLSRHNFYKGKDTSKGRSAGDCLFIKGLTPFLRYRLYKMIQLVYKLLRRVGIRVFGK